MDGFPPFLVQEGRHPCQSVLQQRCEAEMRAASLCQKTVDDFAVHLFAKGLRSIQPNCMLRLFSVTVFGAPPAEEGIFVGEKSADAFASKGARSRADFDICIIIDPP